MLPRIVPPGAHLTSTQPTDGLPGLPQLPQPSARNIAIGLSRGAQRALRQGHPWLYAEAIERQSHEGQPGDLAVIFDHRRRFLAVGLYDPTSAIRVRILQHGQPAPIDEAWFAQKIGAALALRQPLHDDPATDGYRLIHGENDGLPALVLDRYAETGVLKVYTPAWIPHLPRLLPSMLQATGLERLVLRLSRAVAGATAHLHGLQSGQLLAGPALAGGVPFRENGLHFVADVVHGQKTGFFFDHRENRAGVERLARSRDTLNLFAYSGAFSLYAARGGARRIVSQDLSAPALAAAQENFTRNHDHPNIAAAQHELLQGDAFAALQQLHAAGSRFDLVVVDPPSFANTLAELPAALRAYGRLAEGTLRLLRPQGVLVMASCTARVAPDRFYETILRTAAEAGLELHEIERRGHALDHPVTFREGRYLKCLFARLA